MDGWVENREDNASDIIELGDAYKRRYWGEGRGGWGWQAETTTDALSGCVNSSVEKSTPSNTTNKRWMRSLFGGRVLPLIRTYKHMADWQDSGTATKKITLIEYIYILKYIHFNVLQRHRAKARWGGTKTSGGSCDIAIDRMCAYHERWQMIEKWLPIEMRWGRRSVQKFVLNLILGSCIPGFGRWYFRIHEALDSKLVGCSTIYRWSSICARHPLEVRTIIS